MPTYSFLDCTAAISGPGGNVALGSSAGASEEGIVIAAMEDKNIMKIGAGGQGQHSLVANEASTVTLTLLKTSPTNAQLMLMYNYQSSSSVLWGRNSLVVTDLGRGDLITLQEVAFKKVPDITYAKEGGTNVWTFDAIVTDRVLGIGAPSL